jgi:NAD(P)-dependent dehydrogenase (short-subunit alcohol dehydrogenase family)
MNKVALVTGTSSGLGMHIAVMLAKQGYTTYATMRNTAKQDALLALAAEQSVSLQVKTLDVQSSASVNACVDEIMAESGRLDLLVNNAGAGFIKTTEQASEEEVEWVLDVNFKGIVRCTKAVLPIMRKQLSGHIINISSVGGLVGQPFNELYCAAKFAVEGYTESLATYVQPNFNINFTTVEPGGIRSEFANSVLSKLAEAGGAPDDAYLPIFNAYVTAALSRAEEGDTGVFQTSEEVAQVVIDCAAMEKPPLRTRTSEWGEQFCHYKTASDPSGELIVKSTYESSFG